MQCIRVDFACHDRGAGFWLGYGFAVFRRDHEEKMMERGGEVLHKLAADRVPNSISVKHIVADGTIYKIIIETAEVIGADLIIMGPTGPSSRITC